MPDLYRDIFLAFVRVHLLHHAAQAPIFGTEMIEELQHHGYEMSPGTLYPILHGMERAGLLVSEKQNVGGKLRRYYSITDLGRETLVTARARIRELVGEVMEPPHDGPPGAHPGP